MNIHLSLFRWSGEKEHTIGLDRDSKKVLVRVDPKYFRPSEVVSKELLDSYFGHQILDRPLKNLLQSEISGVLD